MKALPPSRLPEELQQELEQAVGDRWVSIRASDRIDAAGRLQSGRQSRELHPGPDAVLWPGSVEEIAKVLRIAQQRGLVLLPWQVPDDPSQAALHLDLHRFQRIVDLSETSQMVEVEVGMSWQRFEEELQRRGFTTGMVAEAHATVGDWLFCDHDCPPGLEDAPELLLGISLVSWDGSLYNSPICVAGSRGSDWIHFLTASRNELGVPVRVHLKVFPIQESRGFVAFGYESVPAGLLALRTAAQRGLGGTFVLLDEMESMLLQNAHEEGFLERLLQRLLGSLPGILPNLFKRGREYWNRGRAALFGKGEVLGLKLLLQQPGIFGALVRQLRGTSTLIGVFEGSAEAAKQHERTVTAVCRELGGRALGTGPAKGWWQQRPALPVRRARFLKEGCVVESFQVSATWDRCPDVYESVRSSLDSKALVLTRFLRATPQGCRMEFSFVAVDDAEAQGGYRSWIEHALDGAFREGGTLGRRSGLGSRGRRSLEAQLGPLLALGHKRKPAKKIVAEAPAADA